MNLLKQLSDIFKLKKLKIKSQTRKTLLKWSKDTKFQERRKKFYEACEPGRVLSKVGICKQKGKRPDWTQELEMLKTKDLRTAISSFLKNLGILDPGTKNLDELAKKNHWSEVITLTQDGLKDEAKTGSGDFRSGRRAAAHSSTF